MYTLISYPTGILTEAFIVSQTATRMRVFAAGSPDVMEFRHTPNGWQTERGDAVDFEFIASPMADQGPTVHRRNLAAQATATSCFA